MLNCWSHFFPDAQLRTTTVIHTTRTSWGVEYNDRNWPSMTKNPTSGMGATALHQFFLENSGAMASGVS